MGSPGSPSFTEALFEDAAGALLLSSSTAVDGGEEEGEGKGEEKGSKGPLAHVVGPGELGIRGAEKDAAAAVAAAVGGGGDEDEDRDEEDSDARYGMVHCGVWCGVVW